jgi:quinol monooxygenase YgiN
MEYIRLVRFTLSQSSLSQASIMAQDLIPAIKQQPGCLSAFFFGGGDDGECGICVQWDGQEHADAAAAIISPRLEGHLAGNTAGQPERGLFPVLAS